MSEEKGTQVVMHRAGLMEDKFFAEKDAALIREYREKVDAQEKMEDMKEFAPFDEATLQGLVATGLDRHTLLAAQLIPLIAVAWSDGTMSPTEAEAILRAAHAEGIEENTQAHRVLEGWLRIQPGDDLFETWKGFISGYAKVHGKIAILEHKIYTLSLNVAESAGGFLRVMAISKSEQRVLDEIKAAFKTE